MPDTPAGDPAAPATPSNEPSAPATPPVVTSTDTGEVERFRKEAEQATLRANQLANELKAKNDADAALKAKELVEKEQFKTLYEEEKAKREASEQAAAAETKKAELKSEADKVLGDYSPEVRKLAETTGLALSDTDDASVAAFKAKLEEVKGLVGSGPRVDSNNPNTPTPEGPSIYNAEGIITRPLDKDPAKLDDIFSKMPGISSMMQIPRE